MKKMEREKKKEKSFYLMAGIRQTNLTGHIERKMYPKVVYFVAVCVCTGLSVLYATFTTHISRCTTNNYSKHPIRSGKKEKKIV